jgi:chorismate synthase
MQKYSYDEARPVLERASARETAARVALGELARRFLLQSLGVHIVSHVVAIGGVRVPEGTLPGPDDLAVVDADPVRCIDPAVSAAMVAEIDMARKEGDTLGGVVEVVVHGLPPGLGSYVHWDRRLDGRLAGAMMSIHAIKGVEIGDGFESAARRGSGAHDEIERGANGLSRLTNRAGGIEGGMSNGEPVVVRVSVKPIPTLSKALPSVNLHERSRAAATIVRSDVCVVPAAAIVGEAMVRLALMAPVLEKYGGDSMEETIDNLQRSNAAAATLFG